MSDRAFPAELPQRLVVVAVRHGNLRIRGVFGNASRPIGILQAMSARDALITSVTGLVRRRGVAGTGLIALLQDSGVARRTVYLNFPGGKEELIAEATREAGQAFTAVIQSTGDDDPAQAIQAFIDQWKAALSESQLEAGCPIVAAILGRAD